MPNKNKKRKSQSNTDVHCTALKKQTINASVEEDDGR
jgi:hypothetical protein